MLTDQQAAILDLEARHWRHAGSKEQAIRAELGLSATAYYAQLNALIDTPAALQRQPVLVNRLRRLRDRRRRARSARYASGAVSSVQAVPSQ